MFRNNWRISSHFCCGRPGFWSGIAENCFATRSTENKKLNMLASRLPEQQCALTTGTGLKKSNRPLVSKKPLSNFGFIRFVVFFQPDRATPTMIKSCDAAQFWAFAKCFRLGQWQHSQFQSNMFVRKGFFVFVKFCQCNLQSRSIVSNSCCVASLCLGSWVSCCSGNLCFVKSRNQTCLTYIASS